jgi:hypothetical protein
MSDHSDRVRALGDRGVQLLPARELLTVIGDLFVELMPVEIEQATADDLARARLMRLALAEVGDRVSRLCPLVTPIACSCGEQFATPDDMDDHLGAAFIPASDIGLDGRKHVEVGF